MNIAKIVNSQSHIQYTARVLDTLDVADPPILADYALGRFVLATVDERMIVGVIADSRLINPDYNYSSPRLTPMSGVPQLFAPDYVNEQGILINIILLGCLTTHGGNHQVPREVLPLNTLVAQLTRAQVADFHRDSQKRLQMAYYSQLMPMAGIMAESLLLAIIEQVSQGATSAEQAKLNLLRQNLKWQQTMAILGHKQ